MTTTTSDRLVLTREDLARLGIKISNTTLLRLEAEVREHIDRLAAHRDDVQ